MSNLLAPIEMRRQKVPFASHDDLIKEMADHIVAGVAGGLCTSNDRDVIACLWNAPQRYHHRLILDHLDAALFEAKQILIAAEMSDG